MPSKSNRYFLVAAFVMLGLLMSLQFKSIKFINLEKSSTEKKIEKLKEHIVEEKKYEEELKADLKKNENKNEEYLKNAVSIKNSDSLNKKLSFLEDVKLKAGLTDVKGPGLVIKLNDALARRDEDPQTIRELIIHDSDVYKILNELKKAGAQAISINNERILATSEQVCAGPTILINKNRYPVPYEIRVIGDAEQMYEGVANSEILYYLLKDNIRVEITKSKELTIPKFSNNLDNLISGLEVVEK